MRWSVIIFFVFLTAVARAENQNDLHVLFDQAHALLKAGDVQGACDLYNYLHEQFPQRIDVWYNLAYTQKICGEVHKAIETLEQIVATKPDTENAQFSLGHSYLAAGDFKKGWKQHLQFLFKTKRASPQLLHWISSEQLAGKRIVVRPEGGLGDTIQFFRCCKWLKDRGAIVYAVVQKSLFKLLQNCSFVDKLVCVGDAVVEYDAATTYMSLPALFNADEMAMGADVPYVTVDPAIENYWHDRIAADKQFKIGICWQADVHNDQSRLSIAHRGIPLKTLLEIKHIKGVSLYSLQKIEGLEQVDDAVRATVHFFDDFDNEHGAFVDTAAIMKQMDVIVSVDSAVVHLAGALGVPVILLLPFSADWRWIMGRNDCPWYPSMHIYKQPMPFDWDSVVDEVKTQIGLRALFRQFFGQRADLLAGADA